MPEGINVFRSAILIFEVVGVFPEIKTDDGGEILGERIILIRSGNNFEVILGIGDEPGPARTEENGSFGSELLFKIVDGAKMLD